MVSKKIYLSFFIVSLWEQMTPMKWLIWNPGACLAGFRKENTKHCNIRNREAESLLDFKNREDFFKSFSHVNSMEAKDHQDGGNLDPRGIIGRIYVGDH